MGRQQVFIAVKKYKMRNRIEMQQGSSMFAEARLTEKCIYASCYSLW